MSCCPSESVYDAFSPTGLFSPASCGFVEYIPLCWLVEYFHISSHPVSCAFILFTNLVSRLLDWACTPVISLAGTISTLVIVSSLGGVGDGL
jgi:hypothetical protein